MKMSKRIDSASGATKTIKLNETQYFISIGINGIVYNKKIQTGFLYFQ
jgi:hypothetical protein